MANRQPKLTGQLFYKGIAGTGIVVFAFSDNHICTQNYTLHAVKYRILCPMTFAEKLAHLQRHAGLSDRKLAQAIDLSPKAVGNLIRRNAVPRPDTAKKVAIYFKVALEEMLDPARGVPKTPLEKHLDGLTQDLSKATKLFPKNLAASKMAFDALSTERIRVDQNKLLASRLRKWALQMIDYANFLDPEGK